MEAFKQRWIFNPQFKTLNNNHLRFVSQKKTIHNPAKQE